MPQIGTTKSRTGCLRCKTRKVKCNEVRPTCGWCAKHRLECEYPSSAHQQDEARPHLLPFGSVELDRASSSHRQSSSGISEVSVPALSPLELGLFHYHVYTVARTFPSVNKERSLELHADIIPQASLHCDQLLHTMFAYALLHMHIQSTVNRVLPRNVDFFGTVGLRFGGPGPAQNSGGSDALSLHRDYFARALQGQRDVLQELVASNADGICVSAILIAQVALVHSFHTMHEQDYAIPSDWFRLQASFSTCLQASRALLKMDSATSVLVHSPPSLDTRDLDSRTSVIFPALLTWQLDSNVEHMTQPVQDTYKRCVVYVESIYKNVVDKEPVESLGRRILAFPSVGASTFLMLLEEHRPRALVILAHLLAIAKRIDSTWWVFQGIADYHVRGITGLVPVEWHWGLEWPTRVVDTNASDECFVEYRKENPRT